MTKKLSIEEQRDACTLYKYKVSVREIAQRYGVNGDTIRRVLHENKVQPPRPKVVIYDRMNSKYGFGQIEVGDTRIVEGDFQKIRVSAYGFRKKWGAYFFVKPAGEGKVLINRYK